MFHRTGTAFLRLAHLCFPAAIVGVVVGAVVGAVDGFVIGVVVRVGVGVVVDAEDG